ncbi:MAG: hypothetical protein H0W51_10335 [Euzebyales bacterium]|nr:hypothetical protein [Euzebyales bacterium]MDQ3342562.1 hypothetical protein [Actinomycetota bacterium]
MSSVVILKWIAGVKQQPIDRDGARRMYVIDKRVAKILSDALDNEAEDE